MCQQDCFLFNYYVVDYSSFSTNFWSIILSIKCGNGFLNYKILPELETYDQQECSYYYNLLDRSNCPTP